MNPFRVSWSLQRAAWIFAWIFIATTSGAFAEITTVEFPASKGPGELDVPATYHLWMPPGVKRVRAVIVHQHGCGDGAERAGETAALDLQWQALAAKHSAALLSPHYHAGDSADCRRWCDPRRGSGETFLRALREFSVKTAHPELEQVPWCLWGHSGGGFWASLMLEKHADRIVAMFCRSGAATVAWEKGEIPEPHYGAEAFFVPIALNPGVGERGDARFDGAWVTTHRFFERWRARGAPVVFAPDPLSNHECRNSRLFAIPYFDACLRLRVGSNGRLKSLPRSKAWSGDGTTGAIAKGAPLDRARGWLPDRSCAEAFSEYVRTGKTTDRSAPAQAPKIRVAAAGEAGIELEWEAEADLESGIRNFVIYRDGQRLAEVPTRVDERTGYAQFQGINYHDAPYPTAPRMRFVDATAPKGEVRYAVSTMNAAGLEGPRSRVRTVKSNPPEHPVSIVPEVVVVDGGESKARPEECRGLLVGPGVNQPDPFPGYRGFVGWESPIRLKNGTWLVGFNAGYWHASPPTPFHYAPKTVEQYVRMGMPADILAPTGGRAMIMRSTDEGKTWSKPVTLIDTPDDDRHPAFVELEDGTLICSFFTYPGEPENGDLEKDPKGAAKVRTVRSMDGGLTWEKESRLLETGFLYDETDGPFLKLRDGSIMMAINGRPKAGPPDQAAVVRSTDKGVTWSVVGKVGTDHDMQEVTVAELSDGRLILMARAEGDVCWSRDGGRTWTKLVTFGMRMFAPSLTVLRDGTLVCLHGSYAPGHGGLRVIFSRDGGRSWVAPAKDHGFLVDSAYGYGKPMELPDGSLYITYLATGGHRSEDARSNGIRCIRMRIRSDYRGIDLLPAPNRVTR